MKFKINLKSLRQKSNLTQKDLADKLNVHQVIISDYELGKLTPSLERVIELALLLNVTLDEFIEYGIDRSKFSLNEKDKFENSNKQYKIEATKYINEGKNDSCVLNLVLAENINIRLRNRVQGLTIEYYTFLGLKYSKNFNPKNDFYFLLCNIELLVDNKIRCYFSDNEFQDFFIPDDALNLLLECESQGIIPKINREKIPETKRVVISDFQF